MDRVRTMFLGVAGALACIGSLAQAQSLPQYYRVIDVGEGIPSAMNNKNQIVGSSSQGAFLYDHATGTRVYLGTLPGGTRSDPLDINENGDVVGQSDGGWGPSTHAFVYRGGSMTEIPMPPGTPSSVSSYAQAITDDGDVVGGYYNGSNITYIHTHGFSMNIPTPGGVEAYAFAINNSWQMAGLTNDGIRPGRAARFNRGVWEDLGTLGSDAFGFAINESGEVAGESYTDLGTRAFVYRNGAMTDLGNLPGLPEAGARSVNKWGQIVGYSSLVGPPISRVRAFIHSGGQMFDLTDMIDPADPLKPHLLLEYATAINDSGWITAVAQGRTYLLQPM